MPTMRATTTSALASPWLSSGVAARIAELTGEMARPNPKPHASSTRVAGRWRSESRSQPAIRTNITPARASPAQVIQPSPKRRVSQPPVTAPTGRATRNRSSTRAAPSWSPPWIVVRAKTGTSTSAAISAAPTSTLTTSAPQAARGPSSPVGTMARGVRRCHHQKVTANSAAATSSHGPAGAISSRSGSAIAKARTTPARAKPSSAAPVRSTARNVVPRPAPRIDSTAHSANSTSVATPIGVASRDSPANGTNGTPRVNDVASRAGATRVSASETHASTPVTTASGRRGATAPCSRTASRTATIRLIQKIQRQFATASTAAPNSGPSTEPSSWTAPTTPSGRPRRCAGHRSATSASVAGTRPPPPTPCRNRPVTTSDRSYDEAVISEPTANSSNAPTSTGVRPTTSAIRPISGSTAMYPSRNPDTIGAARCNSSADRPTPVIMSGSASTTTYVSAAANITATDASASFPRALTWASRRRGLGDGDLLAIAVERDVVGGGGAGVERPADHHGDESVVVLVDPERRGELLCGLGLREEAGQGRPGHRATDLGDDHRAPARLALQHRVLQRRQPRADALRGVDEGRRVRRAQVGELLGRELDERLRERELHVHLAADRDDVAVDHAALVVERQLARERRRVGHHSVALGQRLGSVGDVAAVEHDVHAGRLVEGLLRRGQQRHGVGGLRRLVGGRLVVVAAPGEGEQADREDGHESCHGVSLPARRRRPRWAAPQGCRSRRDGRRPRAGRPARRWPRWRAPAPRRRTRAPGRPRP